MEIKRSSWFHRIFAVAFVLFFGPAEGANPEGNHQHLPNISKTTVKIRQNPLLRFLSMIQNLCWSNGTPLFICVTILKYFVEIMTHHYSYVLQYSNIEFVEMMAHHYLFFIFIFKLCVSTTESKPLKVNGEAAFLGHLSFSIISLSFLCYNNWTSGL